MSDENVVEEVVGTPTTVSQEIEVSVDTIGFKACLPDGFLAYRSSNPEKTFFGKTKTEAKIALLQAESKI